MSLYLTGDHTDNFSALIKNKLLLKLNKDYSNCKIINAINEYKTLGDSNEDELIESNNKIISDIQECNSLVFSLYTRDINSYIELGIALKLKTDIWIYNYLDDSIVGVQLKNPSVLDVFSNSVFPLTDFSSAVHLGYNYNSKFNIYYILGNGFYDTGLLFYKFGKIKKVGSYYTLCKNNEFQTSPDTSHIRMPRGEQVDVDSVFTPVAKKIDMSFILEDKSIITKEKKREEESTSSDLDDYFYMDNGIMHNREKTNNEQ